MTPADKLRELLASSPAMPNTEQLVRWWRTSKELLPGVLAQLDVAVNLDTRDADIIEARREARQLRDDLVHERAQLRREQDARADLRRELDALKLTAEERSGLEAFREQIDADMNAIGDNPIPSDAAMAAIRKVLGRSNVAEMNFCNRHTDCAAADAEAASRGYVTTDHHAHGGPVLVGQPRPSCQDNTPRWYTGHWRDWHRGHGCDKDDGKPRTPEARAEIEDHFEARLALLRGPR